MEVKCSMDGVVNNFYTMITVRQLQLILGCSKATVYRTIKNAKIERYYVPHHPGFKYLWGCSLLKLIDTPAIKKLAKRRKSNILLSDVDIAVCSKNLGLSKEHATAGLLCGLIPIVNNEIPWWYEKAVKGLLILPLPYK